jgi:hypothetical protein
MWTAVIIGSIALILAIPGAINAFFAIRRWLSKPSFEATGAEMKTSPLPGHEEDQVVIDEFGVAILALGGGRAAAIVDSYFECGRGSSWAGAGGAEETMGDKAIPLPAGLITKFELNFIGGVILEREEALECRVRLRTGLDEYHTMQMTLRQAGDYYRYLSCRDSVLLFGYGSKPSRLAKLREQLCRILCSQGRNRASS